MDINEAGQPLGEPDVSQLEKTLGARLPTAYREFLQDCNGGVPEPRHFRWGRGAYQDSAVRSFFHLWSEKDADPLSIEWNIATYQGETARIPRDLLPIACDEGGNRLCLGIHGTRHGKVFFWDHERENPNDPDKALRFVRANFPAFIKSLHTPEKDPEMDVWLCLNRNDYEGLGELIDAGLSPDFVFEHHALTLLEYSAKYSNPTLTELVLREGARENIQNALRIAIERKNKASESLIREVIGTE